MIGITDRGRQALAGDETINNRYLRQFPEFIEFIRGGDEDEGPQPPPQPPIAVETTPEELIETGFRQVQNALASDLLERVKGCSPAFFERLVVELLVKMGYGGSLADAGQRLGGRVTRGSTESSRKIVLALT